MPFFVWETPQGRAVRDLDRTLVVIGSDAACDIVLDDTTVSRRHVLVHVEDHVKITALGPAAGTRINGAKIKPDVPCTLEPGDFLQVGNVVLSFHSVAPPPAPPSPARARPQTPWRPVGMGLAFLGVAAVGAFLALDRKRPLPPPPPPAKVAKEPEPLPPLAVEPAPEPQPPPAPVEPPPAKPAVPERAAAGELPPRGPAADLPDLIEVDGKTYLPVRLKGLGESIEAIGADGRLYAIAAKRVTKIEDRADLVRRVGVGRRRLAPDDVEARVKLAEWCAARLLRDEATALVREALSLKPEDAAARDMQKRLEEQG